MYKITDAYTCVSLWVPQEADAEEGGMSEIRSGGGGEVMPVEEAGLEKKSL